MGEKHYLDAELEELFRRAGTAWDFLRRGSLDGCWYWDLEKPENEWMSPEFWRLFGIDPATRRHDPVEWQDLIFPEDGAVALENFRKHCADPDHPYDQIVRYRHADGSTVWVRCRGIAIRDETGRPIRMLGAHNDLTSIKRGERAVAEKHESDAANQELRTFAYSISHDLKSPANTIYVLLNELEETEGDRLTDGGRELLGLSKRTVERMRSLVDDLLGYTRLIGGELSLEPVDLDVLAHDVVEDLSGDVSGSGAEVAIGHLPAVRGCPVQLRVMMQNLLSNAIKFAKPDTAPHIAVTAGPVDERGRVPITVSDDGIGIPEESQEQIFSVFARLHRADEIPGNGLGLALCRRVALNHGTDLTVASAPGAGAAFTFALDRP